MTAATAILERSVLPPLALQERGETKECDICLEQQGKSTPAAAACTGCGDALCSAHNKGTAKRPACALCQRMAAW